MGPGKHSPAFPVHSHSLQTASPSLPNPPFSSPFRLVGSRVERSVPAAAEASELLSNQPGDRQSLSFSEVGVEIFNGILLKNKQKKIVRVLEVEEFTKHMSLC